MGNKRIDDLLRELDIDLNNDNNSSVSHGYEEYEEYDKYDNDDDYDDYEIDESVSSVWAKGNGNTPVPKRIICAFVPQRGDSTGELIRKIIAIVSLLAVIFCIGMFIKLQSDRDDILRRDEEYRRLKEQTDFTGNLSLNVEKVESIKEEVPGILDEYIPLYDINPDLIGWIKIPGTIIDYPVVQTDNNDFYLSNDFEGGRADHGTIFADYEVPITPVSRPNNTILYGHNMAIGTYFAAVTNYFPRKYGSAEYYKQHPVIEFDTIYEKGVYKVFAGIFINTLAKHNDGYVYDYHNKLMFGNKAEFYDFAQNIMDRSVFYTDVDLEYGDEILTLSTCYMLDLDARFALFARKVREGESADVDTSKAEVNPSPLYFEYYHNLIGQDWAGRNWDTSLVVGLDEFLEKNPDKSTI